jgi:hypothetical protein
MHPKYFQKTTHSMSDQQKINIEMDNRNSAERKRSQLSIFAAMISSGLNPDMGDILFPEDKPFLQE